MARGQLIALGGKLRAGKDEVGDYLIENHEFVKLGMSDPLNEALQKVGPEGPWIKLDFDVYDHAPWEHGRRRGKYMAGEFIRYKHLLDAVGYVESKKHKDVREYLQGLGTEVGREMIDPDVWVNIAEAKIDYLLKNGKNVVLTAVRFPNEVLMIRRLGGTNVWIERSDEARGATDEEINGHKSEQSIDAESFDYVLNNDGTLKQLYRKVEKRLVNGEFGPKTLKVLQSGHASAEEILKILTTPPTPEEVQSYNAALTEHVVGTWPEYDH